ncbi:TRAP transporter small permease subunit [Emcibacter sp.]|uniref:TRAP transporter small permease subunit n=1 Tax=Emcibacter sp. TaxID=1979954 RepID=UPI002AA8272E|nr:TRAP transporter small permease subunit [Emcibacter sp.]
MIEKITGVIDLINEKLGRIIAWATLILVLVQFGIVITHYIFRDGSIFLQESLLYLHSLIFLGAAGYTLKHNGHVRVDVFYGNFSEKAKAWVNLLGTLLFLTPVTVVIGWYSWPFVMDSWSAMEGSIESSGIQAVYLLKSMILLFVFFILLQGLSLVLHSLRIIRGAEHLTEEKLEVV